MKILFITNLCDKLHGFHNINTVDSAMSCSALGLDYPLSLLKELGRYADVDVYSPPLRGYATVTENRQHPHPDIKFQPQQIAVPYPTDTTSIQEGYDILLLYAEAMFSYMTNWNLCKTKKAIWFLSSPQQILLPQYDNVKADLALKVVDKQGKTEFSERFAQLGLKTAWLPLSVDTKRFRNMGIPKIADVCLLGNMNPTVYPLRLKALSFLIKQHKYRLLLKPAYGEEYVKAINEARILLTCSGTVKFPVMKYYEAMACGTLLLADKPLDAEELGFAAERNYVELPDDFRDEQLAEVMEHTTRVADAGEVARLGEELVVKRHSNIVRAKELYDLLVAA